MRSFFLGFAILLYLGCSVSDETDWNFLPPVQGKWESIETYGGVEEDIAHGIEVTTDGGYIVVGNTESLNGDFSGKSRMGSDLFLIKFDSVSNLEWTKTYGGSADDRGHGVVQLEDGGYAVVGYSQSSDGDATKNEGQHDNWVFRTDSKGTIIWQKSYGFLGHDHAYNIIPTSDGGLFFNGFLDVTLAGGAGQEGKQNGNTLKHGVGEFWCHKIDLEGKVQWSRYFGGTSNDRSNDAIETKSGDFVLLGTSESQDFDISNPKGSYDAWIVKIDSKGDLIWEYSLGGSEYDSGKALIETQNGTLLIVGQSYSQDKDITNPLGSSDGILVWMSQQGEVRTIQNFGDSGFDTLTDVIERPDGTLVLLGNSSSSEEESEAFDNDVILYYTQPNGELISKHRLSGDGLDFGEKMVLTDMGKIILVGSTESNSGQFQNTKGGKDLFVAIWN
jgi:hypothetical protein